MNRTLFDCGIKKSVETRKGEKFDITSVLPKSVKLPERPVQCEICKESFSEKKYLDSHVGWKHGGDVSFNLNQCLLPATLKVKRCPMSPHLC